MAEGDRRVDSAALGARAPAPHGMNAAQRRGQRGGRLVSVPALSKRSASKLLTMRRRPRSTFLEPTSAHLVRSAVTLQGIGVDVEALPLDWCWL